MPHLIFYWNAFSHLSSDRQVGMGIGPIPWSSLDRYAIRYRIEDVDQFDVFVNFVRALDSVFLDNQATEVGSASG